MPRMAIREGDPFPKFSLQNQDQKTVRLADYAGKWLVLYIYPKDDTPGCTIQGKSFTATKEEFDGANAVAVGLSADDVASHQAFCNKIAFTIELPADLQTKLLTAHDVPVRDWKGSPAWVRTTFLVDPQGIVRKTFAKVDPNGHERAVLVDIKALAK